MNAGNTLDLIIKKAETNGNNENKGYVINGRTYYNYIDNENWQKFVLDMQTNYPAAFKEYGEGAGDELGIKKIGRFPPKMASYGSSSRMIYMLSRNIDSFCFEKKLPTTIGGIAHMDGYLFRENKRFYIEAKCREPYSSNNYMIDRKYEELYRYIDASNEVALNCSITLKDQDKMKVEFSTDKMTITRFDIKQMISHLLGIATEFLHNPSKDRLQFLYLLYNPTLIQMNEEQKKVILPIYETETKECESIPFQSLFHVILEYLKKHKINSSLNIDDCVSQFNFCHCDQSSYIEQLTYK